MDWKSGFLIINCIFWRGKWSIEIAKLYLRVILTKNLWIYFPKKLLFFLYFVLSNSCSFYIFNLILHLQIWINNLWILGVFIFIITLFLNKFITTCSKCPHPSKIFLVWHGCYLINYFCIILFAVMIKFCSIKRICFMNPSYCWHWFFSCCYILKLISLLLHFITNQNIQNVILMIWYVLIR